MSITLDSARRRATNAQTGLVIKVSTGVGTGRTRLAAFDAALRNAGLADFNLIRLSSVIPPGSIVSEVGRHEQLRGDHGDRLYCVYAESFASTPHSEAWAGVAWSTREDGSGAGLFVEHSGLSEQQVSTDLDLTLEDLSIGRGGIYHPAGKVMASAVCEDHPVCALVIASYSAQGWDGHDH
ncbi:arginine decarboxylase [Friedmanniella endophytica]|uniref:Pyruvoyl-dependent arginine decarboxylase AaxB n=1 Tax=Microlunatus kandeliicorticis TaxID=1759536 RepID=A0A7W3IQ27_9ACTN|nr:pyruvoyl-dependent arginine decarboxylase [Microlunatus kandeliicorticis]MBA8793172.1 arginine decarboxylase [Microlunatus kandeliicorticis]